MSFGGRDLKSLNEEVRQLEQELKLVRSGQTTRERCAELTKYVKENEAFDPLVAKIASNPFTQQRSSGGCCG
eukprot:CAMPEP_0171453104 /NCGR_PEP_ID=MMETSP0945-20130129/949_1 /TAXON_ID=109269 /ORGANISM="Vaucheria litorea, Strain CCMP2940" /LENGTH=71 /DNA_ID=CAMNT_0011977911 /DNA_START=74 /DNA_END=289 /DNA_ORIENTATION=+